LYTNRKIGEKPFYFHLWLGYMAESATTFPPRKSGRRGERFSLETGCMLLDVLDGVRGISSLSSISIPSIKHKRQQQHKGQSKRATLVQLSPFLHSKVSSVC